MSILAAAAAPPVITRPQLIAFSIVFVALLVTARLTPLFRPGRLSGSDRLPPGRSAWWLVLIAFAAFAIAWVMLPLAYVTFKAVAGGGDAVASLDPQNLTPVDVAFLSLGPAVVGLLTILLGILLCDRRLFATLGMSARLAPRGAAYGALAAVLVIPLMIAAGVLLQGFYQAVQYEHPSKHLMLIALQQATNVFVRGAIVVGAVIGAPVFEEIFFRAHLQTAVRRLARYAISRPSPSPAPDASPAPAASPGLDSPPVPQVSPITPVSPAPDVSPALVASPAHVASPAEVASPAHVASPARDAQRPPVLPTAAPLASELPPPLPIGYAAPLPPEPLPLASPADKWAAWIAILVTSVVFALFHELWTAPLIFLLSIAFGYAYERTANLYVPITLHLLFNGFNTLLVLLGLDK